CPLEAVKPSPSTSRSWFRADSLLVIVCICWQQWVPACLNLAAFTPDYNPIRSQVPRDRRQITIYRKTVFNIQGEPALHWLATFRFDTIAATFSPALGWRKIKAHINLSLPTIPVSPHGHRPHDLPRCNLGGTPLPRLLLGARPAQSLRDAPRPRTTSNSESITTRCALQHAREAHGEHRMDTRIRVGQRARCGADGARGDPPSLRRRARVLWPNMRPGRGVGVGRLVRRRMARVVRHPA
ncbi:hypothetical protein B0H11DRAFT_2429737, partial [Mycena galericulata]